MRFTKGNWQRFFDGHNKCSTIRPHKKRIGHYTVVMGSYYKPIKVGELDIVNIIEKRFGTLTEQDAKDDGFDTLEELKREICFLNDGIAEITPLWKCLIVDVEATADNTNFKTATPKLKQTH